jgi:hypothetical protein
MHLLHRFQKIGNKPKSVVKEDELQPTTYLYLISKLSLVKEINCVKLNYPEVKTHTVKKKKETYHSTFYPISLSHLFSFYRNTRRRQKCG